MKIWHAESRCYCIPSFSEKCWFSGVVSIAGTGTEVDSRAPRNLKKKSTDGPVTGTTSIRPPPQHLGHHGNGFASTLPPLSDLLCHYSSFGGSKRHTGRAAAVTQQQNFLGFWSFYWTLKGGTKIAALCNGALTGSFTCVSIFSVTCKICKFSFFSNDQISNNSSLSSFPYVCNHQFRSENGIGYASEYVSNVHSVIGSPLFVPLVALRWSHSGTALAPGHVGQVNKLVFWINDVTPDVVSSYTAGAVVKVELNSNQISRDLPTLWRPIWTSSGWGSSILMYVVPFDGGIKTVGKAILSYFQTLDQHEQYPRHQGSSISVEKTAMQLVTYVTRLLHSYHFDQGCLWSGIRYPGQELWFLVSQVTSLDPGFQGNDSYPGKLFSHNLIPLSTFDRMRENRRPRTRHFYSINSLLHRDTIWRHQTGSALSQKSRHLNHCRLIVSTVKPLIYAAN